MMKKIYGMVSDSTFETLKSRNLFNSGWDEWLEIAIIEKLERAG